MQTLNRLITLCIAISISGVLIGCATKVHSQSGKSTTIILTRHAERTAITRVLTDIGHARARKLVKVVGKLNITAIYSPDLERNLDTVRPLAKYLGIDITKVSSKPEVEKVVTTLLTKHPGEVVLWVGNTTNLGGIYYKLGGQGDVPDNYGDIAILKIKDQGPPEVIKKRY